MSAPMRMAYADPPYLGCCNLYGHHHEAPFGCWDNPSTHLALVEMLCDQYPDGWALSLSTPSMRTILPMCPDDVRVASWVKSFCAFKKGVRPCYSWEPIIFRGGRNPNNGHPHAPPEKGGKQNTPKDFVIVEHDEFPAIKEPITLRKGLTGAKPRKVCDWVLDLLNVQPGDIVDDIFTGTGVMGEAIEARLAPNLLTELAAGGA